MWGHTEQWYQKGIGSVNRQDVIDSIKDTRLKNVPEPQRTAQANKIYKSLPKDSGRLLIAKEINRYYPGLSPAESKAMADQVYYSHLLGDSTTREGISPLLTQKAENILSRPSKEAMTAMNKTMILEAGENYRRLPYQPVNAERLMVENLAQKQGYKICNFNAKDTIGVIVNGEECAVAYDANRAGKIRTRFPDKKILLPKDEYERYIRKHGHDSNVRPLSKTQAEFQNDGMKLIEQEKTEITASAQKVHSGVRQKMWSSFKKMSPYLIAGALQAGIENWEDIKDAWNGDKYWGKVLAKTGTDFVGYTATPAIVDAVLVSLPGKAQALIAPLKDAGIGTIIGIFIYGSGKECYSYVVGDISQETLMERLKIRGKSAVQQMAFIPVTAVLAKVCAGSPLLVPMIIIGGSFAWQKCQAYYEEQQWKNMVSIEDLRALLGDDFVREFSLLMPEERDNILEPLRRDNILESLKRDNLIEPLERDNILEPRLN